MVVTAAAAAVTAAVVVAEVVAVATVAPTAPLWENHAGERRLSVLTPKTGRSEKSDER